MTCSVDIALLADHPWTIPVLRDAFEEVWAPYYGPQGPGDAHADLLAASNRDRLPIGLVALVDGAIAGTAALKTESVTTFRHLSPWLAGLLVLPRFRHLGAAAALIDRVVQLARAQGYHEMFVGAGEHSGLSDDLLLETGWVELERGDYFVSEVIVYKKQLK